MEKPHQTQLLLEWSEKNDQQLNDYSTHSHHRAWWTCPACEYEWQAIISNRRKGSGCPNCAKIKRRGANNHAWKGYGEIGGRQWMNIKADAAEIPFSLTIQQAWELFLFQNRKCAISGRTLTMWGKVNGNITGTALLDRINPDQGYDAGNVQWIHKDLQAVKRNLSEQAFIRLCQDVTVYQSTKRQVSFPPSFREWTKHESVTGSQADD